MLSTTEIKYFVEIANTKKLSAAASNLGVSQPTLTESIKKMELNLGVQLLFRLKYGVELTEAGLVLFRELHGISLHWEKIKLKLLHSQNELTGTVSLGCHTTVGLICFEKFIPRLLDQNRNLSLNLDFDMSQNIVDKVVDFHLDFGLAINPLLHPDLLAKKILSNDINFWTSKNDKNAQNSIESHDKVLIFNKLVPMQVKLVNRLVKSGIVFKRFIQCSSYENSLNLVVSGAGIGLLPTVVIHKHAFPKLELIANTPSYKDHLLLVYRKERKNTALAKLMGEAIVNAFKKGE